MTLSKEITERIEKLKGISPAYLTEVERQDLYMVKALSKHLRCPGCYEMTTYLDALPDGADWGMVVGSKEANIVCPHCHTSLEYVVPFMGAEFFTKKVVRV